MKRKLRALLVLLTCGSPALAQERPSPTPERPPVNAGTPSDQELRAPAEDDSFRFAVFGDRTSGEPPGLKVLRDAVSLCDSLDPAFVMTVGDLVQGYNAAPKWLEQMREYKTIMSGLKMPWYPVAGNHDVYSRPRSPEGNIPLWKAHFGPLYYSFDYKWAHFVILFTDEALDFHDPPKTQNMSAEQLAWLQADLAASKAEQVFVFQHHPRWIKRYEGSNWPAVDSVLAADGRVRAVFAGHIHRYRDDGVRNGIHYYTLATTGGAKSRWLRSAAFDHVNLVSVRRKRFAVSVVPVGSVWPGDVVRGAELDAIFELDDGKWLRIVDGAKQSMTTSEASSFSIAMTNPTDRPLRIECTLSQPKGWTFTHPPLELTLPPGQTKEIQVQARAEPISSHLAQPPRITARVNYSLASGRRQQISVNRAVPVTRTGIEAWAKEEGKDNKALLLDGKAAVRVDLPLEGVERLTLECWVRGESPKGRVALAAKTQNSSFGLFWSHEDDRRLSGSVHLQGTGYVVAKAAKAWTWGRWTHVALVYDGESVRLFVDGQPAGEMPGEGKITTNRLPFFVGADPSGRGDPVSCFRGAIDDLRLSKVARYREAFEPPRFHAADADTLLLMPFDAKLGVLVPDLSGRGHHGRLVGAAKLGPGRGWN